MGNCFSDSSQPKLPRSANYTSNTGVSSNTNSSYEVDTSNLGSFGSCIPNSEELTHTDVPEGSLRAFSYSDLKAATRNFREALGEGGFGVVYKGYVDKNTLMPSRPSQGMIVAVKRLKGDAHQGHREWLAEVRFLGALHHPNLVNLIGFCSEDSNRLLVYEFMSRGSLENHLFRRGSQPIPWTTRMKIAIDAAKGLAFLHSPERQVIFRDFKASNILLDIDWNAKLSDFGLAKSGPSGDNTHVSTRIMGTHGYAAPEYLATGHLSAGSDVYSFGVVLLELLTGRRSVDSQRSNEEKKLVDWARPYLRHRKSVLQIVDERLGDQFPRRGAIKVANLAAQCLNEVKKERPTMKEVLDSLESLTNLGINVE